MIEFRKTQRSPFGLIFELKDWLLSTDRMTLKSPLGKETRLDGPAKIVLECHGIAVAVVDLDTSTTRAIAVDSSGVVIWRFEQDPPGIDFEDHLHGVDCSGDTVRIYGAYCFIVDLKTGELLETQQTR